MRVAVGTGGVAEGETLAIESVFGLLSDSGWKEVWSERQNKREWNPKEQRRERKG